MKALFRPVDGGPVRVTAKLTDGHELQGYFQSEGEGKAFFTPIIEQLCIGDLVSFQESAISNDPRKRPPIKRFEVSAVTVFCTDTIGDPEKRDYVDRLGRNVKKKVIKCKLNREKPEGIDQQLLYPWGQQ
jgi:hypothetical protein